MSRSPDAADRRVRNGDPAAREIDQDRRGTRGQRLMEIGGSMGAAGSRQARVPRLFVVLLVSLGCVAGACSRSSGSSTARYEATYFLTDHVEESVPRVAGRHPLRNSILEIGFDQRRVLLQDPPSAYRFPDVPSAGGASLSVAPAMNPPSGQTDTDGAGFEVRCSAASGEDVQLLAVSVSPVARPRDRTWLQQEIPLAACSQPRTSIELRTTCGTGPTANCNGDLTAWGDPKIIYENTFETGIRRLVLLISIDTLRPDHMSLYGAERPTTPALERFARDGVVFDTAVAPSPWTVPSHASLLTSTDPDIHGANAQTAINGGVPLVAEILRAAGWVTIGVVDTPWLGTLGFDRGYEHYDAEPKPGSPRRGADVTAEHLLDLLNHAAGDVFAFWHIMDVHGPYGSPGPFGGRFRRGVDPAADGRLAELGTLAYHDYLQLGRFRNLADLTAAYDEGIAAVDAVIARVLDILEKGDLYDEALIIVASDHGESFMDHGIWVGHGLFLTDPEIRIPLVVKFPAGAHAGTRVGDLVRLIDVAPTVLDIVDVPFPASFQGLSLLHLVDPPPGAARPAPRVAFGTSSNTGARYVRTRDFKLITTWTTSPGDIVAMHLRPRETSPLIARIDAGERLFDLSDDPDEAHDVIGQVERTRVLEMLRGLDQRRVDLNEELRSLLAGGRGGVNLSEAQIRRLRSLGYLRN